MPTVPAFIEISEIKEKDIEENKIDTGSTYVIPYKDWEMRQKPSEVYELPIQYCKFRLENGRIKTEILSHIKVQGKLKANEDETQKIISDYLGKSDRKTNEDLKKILKKEGQKDPAIITADGYLINGNRRCWAFQQLLKEDPDERFKKLKVVILPGTKNPERPTISDIAVLESRLQNYKTGKSEYTKMNKALTYYSYTQGNVPLEEILKYDATFGDSDEKKFKKNVQKFKKEYFEPIKLMDEYLESIGTPGDYKRVANRWMSFEELAVKVTSQLKNEKFLVENNIEKNEIGIIKSAGFNLIKIKDSHEVAADNRFLIRELVKWIKTEKKDVLKIGKIEDVDKEIKDIETRDSVWQENQGNQLIKIIKKLQGLTERAKDQEDPLNRLREALSKLKHEDLEVNQLEQMKIPDVEIAFKLCNDIEAANNELKRFFYAQTKDTKDNIKKLKKKFNN